MLWKQRVSGITFTRYAQNQKSRKSNNWKVLGSGIPKGLLNIANIGNGHISMMEENLSFNVIFFKKNKNKKKHHYLTLLNLALYYQLKSLFCNLNDVPRYMFPKYKSLLSFIKYRYTIEMWNNNLTKKNCSEIWILLIIF